MWRYWKEALAFLGSFCRGKRDFKSCLIDLISRKLLLSHRSEFHDCFSGASIPLRCPNLSKSCSKICLSEKNLPGANLPVKQKMADYTVRGVCDANDLLLLSRASSDACKPYMFQKGYSEESLIPVVSQGNSNILTHFTVPTSVSASVSVSKSATCELSTGLSKQIPPWYDRN